MTRVVKGIVSGGLIEPIEPLTLPDGTRVDVTFDDAIVPAGPGKMIRRGMFKPADGSYTTGADFLEAKRAFGPKERRE